MIEINGKIYRNLQEQVKKNMEDIEDLQQGVAVDAYTKEEADAKFETISDVYGNFYTRDQSDDRFPTESHMEFLLGHKQDTLTAGSNITIDSNNVISAVGQGGAYTAGNGIDITNNVVSIDSTKVYTKEEADQKFVPRNIDFDDEDNPETYHFAVPTSYNGHIGIDASQDDNHHPCDAEVYVFPSYVTINAYDYNHGDNDDTYTGSINVYDTSINLSVDTGDNKMHLRITDNDISYSTDGTNYNSLISNPVSTYQLALGTASNKFWFATITAESGLEGTYGPENSYD